MRVFIGLIVSLALAACTQFPEIDEATDQSVREADYPTLVPLDPIKTQIATAQTDPEEIQTQLAARAALLKARAASLRATAAGTQDQAHLEDDIE